MTAMESSRQSHACARCSERKVKCDRKLPCGACVRLDLDCAFLPLPPRNRRRRPSNATVQIQALAGRLREYEAWFRARGIDPESLPVDIPRQPESEPSEKEPLQTTQLTQSPQSTQSVPSGANRGRLRFANNVLWTRVIEEFDPQDDPNITHDSSDDDVEVRLKDAPISIGPSFIFANHPSPHGHRPEHPPLDMSHRLWQLYCENVDPLTKILHVPTVKHAMENAFRDTSTVSRAFEALVFAVYASAVMSLREDECSKTLGEPRSVLLSRYLAATEMALMRANVLGTTEIVVLQALLLYLLAVRDLHEPRAVWTLTGVAMRLAEGMGLDRDGVSESPPLSPFDIEMRRRLWWQLRVHDFRTAELCGRPKFQDLEMDSAFAAGSMATVLATQWPANVDDAALSPAMEGNPLPPLGEASAATDAVFVAAKCELLRFAAARLRALRRQPNLDPSTNPWRLYTATSALDNDFADIEDRLETRYLRYCDPSKPLHLMATLMARCAVNIMRFMARHPRRWTDRGGAGAAQNKEERAVVWRLCLAILDQQHMLQSNPHLRSFAWHAPFFQQWYAIIHVLDTLRAEPGVDQAARAWHLIEKTYANNPEMLSAQSKKPIHVAVGHLCLKAFAQHEAVAAVGDTVVVPSCVVQLRKSREAAARRATGPASKAQHQTVQTDKSSTVVDDQTMATGVDAPTGGAEIADLDLLVDMDIDPAVSVDWNQWDTWLVGAGV